MPSAYEKTNSCMLMGIWRLKPGLCSTSYNLFMLHLFTIRNKMPQRPRKGSNPSQASVVRGQRPGKGPFELEGSQSRTMLIRGYSPADGCLERQRGGGGEEGEGERGQKQDKVQRHTSVCFFFKSLHLGMWWLIITLAVLVGGENQLGKCQWEITNDVCRSRPRVGRCCRAERK